jgi:short-subunit dehydrogenase
MLDKARAANTELDALPAFVVGSAEAVADEGFEACMKGEVIRVPGALNLAAAVAGRATPRWLLRRVSGAMVRRLKPRD